MSLEYDLLFNSTASLKELGESINAVVGCRLAPYERNSEDLFCRWMGIEFSLHEVDLEDDMGIPLSRFRFSLGTRTPVPDSRRRRYQLEATVLAAYVILFDGVAEEGILVEEVQRLLASYRRSEQCVYDDLRDEVVDFPAHFDKVRTLSSLAD